MAKTAHIQKPPVLKENYDVYYFPNKTLYNIRDGKVIETTTFEEHPFVVYDRVNGVEFIYWAVRIV